MNDRMTRIPRRTRRPVGVVRSFVRSFIRLIHSFIDIDTDARGNTRRAPFIQKRDGRETARVWLGWWLRESGSDESNDDDAREPTDGRGDERNEPREFVINF